LSEVQKAKCLSKKGEKTDLMISNRKVVPGILSITIIGISH
jgi:hypothetical protein